jgi:hypothetical protein
MDKAMEAYDVFADAAKTHALKVVLTGTPVAPWTKLKVAVTASA